MPSKGFELFFIVEFVNVVSNDKSRCRPCGINSAMPTFDVNRHDPTNHAIVTVRFVPTGYREHTDLICVVCVLCMHFVFV